MPRRKQLAPKRLKGGPGKDTEGDANDEDDDSQAEEMEESGIDVDDKITSPLSPTASWSVKFRPYGSTTEKVMGTSIPVGSPSITKVHSKGTWYPDESEDAPECSNSVLDSSFSEGEQEKPKKPPRIKQQGQKDSQRDVKETRKDRKAEKKEQKITLDRQDESDVDCPDDQHSPSTLIKENLRHYFRDKLKASGKLTSPDKSGRKRKLSGNSHHEESQLGGTVKASTSGYHRRESYKHTVLWKPAAEVKHCSEEPLHPLSDVGMERLHGDSSRKFGSMRHPERTGMSSDELHGSSSKNSQSDISRTRTTSGSSPSHSSEPEIPKTPGSDQRADAMLSGSLSPSEYYHHASANMGYYPSPFMGYGLYPPYPNLVYPYNYGYVVAVPGGLFIPMGGHSSSSYTPSPSGEGQGRSTPRSDTPHKEKPLDLSACPSAKKEKVEVKPKIKREESAEPSSSARKPTTNRAKKVEDTTQKKKGEKTIVLWKKVPRQAMMMDMAQLSVLEKVHVLYTTESTFLCFICSDCNALFNSLDLLVLHAVGTAHTSKDDIDIKAMGQKGFEVIPIDKIAKKQKHVEKKPEFSFESPLQSTVSLHRRRLPGSKECVPKNRDVYKCSVCPDTFPNFLQYTMHMNETGHRRKSVRYTDVYKAQKQVKKILKCMNCEKSFMTLEELTMHMIKTKHYSDIAGGFGNQSEPEEDTDFDTPCPAEDGQPLGEYGEFLHPVDDSAKRFPQRPGADGTSSDSEGPRSRRGSPLGHWRTLSQLEKASRVHSPARSVCRTEVRHAEPPIQPKQKVTQRIPSLVTAHGNPDQNGSIAGTSYSDAPSSPRQKRDHREVQDQDKNNHITKRIKMEVESEAEDDDYQTFGGYESENEFEEDDDVESFDPELSFKYFGRIQGVDRDNSTSSSSWRKHRQYKHSLLYKSREQPSLPNQGPSAFDGLYKWAKSLGLLSSPTACLTTKQPPSPPKAVVKCDGKYVDPDNFDVTLPYGGKVIPDANPLGKLSSMVETTESKQPKSNSFESNFIMDRAYFNFEKAQGYATPSPKDLSSSFRSEDSGSRVGSSMPHSTGDGDPFKPQLGAGWMLDGSLSQDAVLERLILKAYDRPSRTGHIPKKDDEFCNCPVNMTRNKGNVKPSESRNPCEVCSTEEVDQSKEEEVAQSGEEQGNQLRENKRGKDLHNKRKLSDKQEDSHPNSAQFGRQFFSAVGRDHLQELMDRGSADKEPVREVKFTWADAIDTLISRSFGAEEEPNGPQLTLQERMQMKLQSKSTVGDAIPAGEVPEKCSSRIDACHVKEKVKNDGSVSPKDLRDSTHQLSKDRNDEDKLTRGNSAGDAKAIIAVGESCRETSDGSSSSKDICRDDDRSSHTPEKEDEECDHPQQEPLHDNDEDYKCPKEMLAAEPTVDPTSVVDVIGKQEDLHMTLRTNSSNTITNLPGDENDNKSREGNHHLDDENKPDEGHLELRVSSSLGQDERSPLGHDASGNNGSSAQANIVRHERHDGPSVGNADDTSPIKKKDDMKSEKAEETSGRSDRVVSRHSPKDKKNEAGSLSTNSMVISGDISKYKKPENSTSPHEDAASMSSCIEETSPTVLARRSSPQQRLMKDLEKDSHPLGFLRLGHPPPLIPTVDASTTAIQGLEELTRKPAVTNVKEMILSKIHEEVERLMGPSDRSECTHPLVPRAPSLPSTRYLIPRAENNNSSGRSLKSLENLSRRASSPPYHNVHADPRIPLSEQPLARTGSGFEYLLPSSVPESKVSAIHSLEKLSTEHPVLQRERVAKSNNRKEPPQVPISVPAEKVQYLPPSFGHESTDVNSIRSLERFSSRQDFFPFAHDIPHSRLPTKRHGGGNHQQKLGNIKKEVHKLVSSDSPKESPLIVSLPKLEPLSPSESGEVKETPAIKVKQEPPDREDTTETAGERVNTPPAAADGQENSSKDPLLALNDLVKKNQTAEGTSPSPRRVAWEIVNKDLKPPPYILPTDAEESQNIENPLKEMDKMVKFS